jgi:homoserine dehydrogenase
MLHPRSSTSHTPRPLRVALLGLGNVGRGVWDRLRAEPGRFELVRAIVRDPARHAAAGVPRDLLSSDPWDALRVPAEVVVEALGGESPAAGVLHAALLHGRRVVTANKLAVVAGWAAFQPWAEGRAPRLRFSAAVGGEVPVLETLHDVARHDAVRSLRGVLNGTCNFVLDRVAEGRDYAAAVAEAQALGFAEPDPAADVSGYDAECKLRLAAWAGFGRAPDSLVREGIEGVTAARRPGDGALLRLVAELALEGGALHGRIGPRWCRAGDYLAAARGEENRVEIETSSGARIRLAGRGAGREPTASAVASDLDAVWQEHAALLATGAKAGTVAYA